MNFDDINIRKIDTEDMQSQIASLYLQIKDSISIAETFFTTDNRYNNIKSYIDRNRNKFTSFCYRDF